MQANFKKGATQAQSASAKAVFVKNRTRAHLFVDIGKPPEPVVTRLGT